MAENINSRREYYLKNREYILKRQKEYNDKNKDIIKEKLKNDPDFKQNRANIMKKYYDNLKNNDPEKYEYIKTQSKERSKKYREIKKQEKIDNGTYNYNMRKPRVLTDEERKEHQKQSRNKYYESIKEDPEKYKKHKLKCLERSKKYYNKNKNDPDKKEKAKERYRKKKELEKSELSEISEKNI